MTFHKNETKRSFV